MSSMSLFFLVFCAQYLFHVYSVISMVSRTWLVTGHVPSTLLSPADCKNLTRNESHKTVVLDHRPHLPKCRNKPVLDIV